MKIDIVSVFPEYFEVMNLSLMGKAQAKGLLEIKAHNLRDWTHDVHHSVMIRQSAAGRHGDEARSVERMSGTNCWDSRKRPAPPAPIRRTGAHLPETHRPPLFTQRDATELSHADHLLFGCGRYEATMRASRATTAPGRRRTRIFDRRLCAERRRSGGVGDA